MSIEKLTQKIILCQKCSLAKTRTNVVPGAGNVTAEIMFIGEAPGKNEDLKGKPFIGAAGKLLDELISSIKLKRENVYIANIVKCQPPKNRDPLPEEVSACWPYLEKQIQLIKPKIIILLGRHSLFRFNPQGQISRDHGKTFYQKNPILEKIIFFPSYHPAAALYNRSLRETLFKDFQKIPGLLGQIKNTPKKRNLS